MNRTLVVLVCLSVLVPGAVTAATERDAELGVPIRLAWDPNDEPVAGYVVYIGHQSGVYDRTFTVSGTTFDFDTAIAGQRYYFAVAAYHAGPLLSALSNEVSAVSANPAPAPPPPPPPPVQPPPVPPPPAEPPVAPPDPPVDPPNPGASPTDPTAPDEAQAGSGVVLQPASVSAGVATFAWSAVGGPRITDYVVEIGSVTGASDLLNQSVGVVQRATATVGPDGTYYVRVRGRTSTGKSLASNEMVFSTKSPRCSTAPQTPQKLVASRTGGQAVLSWKRVSGATSYVVQIGSQSGRSDLGHVAVGRVTTTVDVPGAGPLFARVIAVNSCGSSAASVQVRVE